MSDESRPPPAPTDRTPTSLASAEAEATTPTALTATASASIAEPARTPLAESDVLFVAGKTQDGDVAVIRSRFGQVEAGVLAPLREGQPLHGEVVSLKPRPEHPRLCDVKVEVPRVTAAKATSTPAPEAKPAPARKGPPKVSTAAYRQNWDQIWAHGSTREPKPN